MASSVTIMYLGEWIPMVHLSFLSIQSSIKNISNATDQIVIKLKGIIHSFGGMTGYMHQVCTLKCATISPTRCMWFG